MSPAFNSQDFVLAVRWPWSRFYVGQAILANHPRYRLIVKRIALVEADQVFLEGDHPDSTSSQAMGPVSQQQLMGVCWHIKH